MKQITEIDDPRLVKALAHPLRVRVLRVLERRIASPNELATELEVPLGNVSYHVRALARIGLIELATTAQRRGAVEHYYRSTGPVRVTARAWAQVPGVVRARLVRSGLDQLGELAGRAATDGGFERADSVLSRRSLILDDTGFTAMAEAAGEFLDRILEIERGSAARLDDGGSDPGAAIPACVSVMLFETDQGKGAGDATASPALARASS
jgi:DNA-binding transcriptional ArsR family regulator